MPNASVKMAVMAKPGLLRSERKRDLQILKRGLSPLIVSSLGGIARLPLGRAIYAGTLFSVFPI